MADVYLSGRFVGQIDEPIEFANKIIEDRRKGSIPNTVNVFYDEQINEVHVEAGKGRLRRPLIVVSGGKPLVTSQHIEKVRAGHLSWSDLVKEGVIEYLDAGEEENALIAFYEKDLTPKHTHVEISPMSMFGIVTSLVPFANYSSAQKVNTGSKNQKQAIGFYASNFSVRMDMDVNLMHNPQIPVVQSIMHPVSGVNTNPAGQNIVVAVMSYHGYNMEDAVIINRGAIERGMGRGSYFRPAIAEELRYSGGLVDEITIPDKNVRGFKSEHDYRFLEGDGIIFPEAKVKEGDVIIGKTSPQRFLSGMEAYDLTQETRRESSLAMKHGEEGVIDFVAITENEEGNKLVQVRIRDQRIPEIGDKFSSRHGQKGVVGLIVPHADMPFSNSGITPDLIFSPHGIPTRMTLSHLLELVAAKVGTLSARYVDGTIFDAEAEVDLREELLSLGFREDGAETMYNGQTGEAFEVKIFIGDMYYLRLKHMVANKIHSRARGPIQLLTRQPTEGRAKEGGLRLGEMEKDTFVAHGASLLLKERFDADKARIPVCEECGLVAIYDEFKRRGTCPVCGETASISFVEMAYAFKLILGEFMTLGVYPKLVLKTKY
ncbi:MAG TPA: DNA-directed RNA polymerase subunit B [Candidatus Nanoarchaeia archaeon]|nr:DNA-directed RNA polymerase subunit B [Candidatus Nanoarchaeia archaeon]